MFKSMCVEEFNCHFKNDEDCRKYLFELKWLEGFQCSRCGHTNHHKGKTKYHLRCTVCLYAESATANTIFHKIKIPLLKAFGMVFRIVVRKKGISTLELSREFSINRKTAWLFKRKIQEVLKTGDCKFLNAPLESIVFRIGGAEAESRSQFSGQEQMASVTVEKKDNGKLGRATGKILSDNELTQFSKTEPSTDSCKTEEHCSQVAVEKKPKVGVGNNNKAHGYGTQIVILNLRNWLRGIHHHCSAEFADGYLQEFLFRFNRRDQLDSILHESIVLGLSHKPYFYRPAKLSLGNPAGNHPPRSKPKI